jgi:DNA mismatch repair ATPase MutS
MYIYTYFFSLQHYLILENRTLSIQRGIDQSLKNEDVLLQEQRNLIKEMLETQRAVNNSKEQLMKILNEVVDGSEVCLCTYI